MKISSIKQRVQQCKDYLNEQNSIIERELIVIDNLLKETEEYKKPVFLKKRDALLKSKSEISSILKLSDIELKFILSEYNREGVNHLINEGESLNMYSLGCIRLEVKKIKKPRVDWNASNKVKDLIISSGGTPYHKEKAPHGRKWLVLRDEDKSPYFIWGKPAIKGNKAIVFEASKGRVGIVTKLAEARRANPDIDLKYKEYAWPNT
jgi:hypothetical protein